MKAKKLWKNIPFMITITVNIFLFAAVIYLMNYVQTLLDSDVKINLTEVVTQNKNVINSKLRLEVTSLVLVADQIADRLSGNDAPDFEAIKNSFLDYSKNRKTNTIFVATQNGRAFFADGSEVDVAGRSYFRLALQGIQNISERTLSRFSGDDIFVISVPLVLNNTIIGTVQKSFLPSEMYKLCAVPLFSAQGSMHIINSRGYILFTSQHDLYNRESDNFFRLLYATDKEAAQKLEEDIKGKISGFMETSIDGKKTFSAYTPIENIYDWHIITSVATNAVSPNANIVIKLFYFILSFVVLFFACSMFYFMSYKNKQHANLERIAFVDPITQGSTYSKFVVDVQAVMHEGKGKQFYIFTFDIENFKYINKLYSFSFGDAILKRLYEGIQARLFAGEYIARIYSDHFVAFLQYADAARLTLLLEAVSEVNGIKIYLAAGLYPITDTSDSINLMVDKANIAARSNKGTSRKHITVYSESFDKQLIKNEQLKRAVEQALVQDEIVPFFQPKVDINTGKLVGAEALARWITKEGKLISPGEFIPVCETTGLIVSVDMTIFEKTLRFIKENLDRNVICAPISVNFSQLHFLDDDFLNTIINKIKEFDVPPQYIELELTESVIFDNHQNISNFITSLHEHGLTVSMDDFGSGYSSLNMLKDIPIDVLKIDRGFLKGTVNSERQRTIFAAVAQMAHNLNIKVVVEGVENEENISLMREYGCTVAQGFYYAKPMDATAFEKIYAAGKVC